MIIYSNNSIVQDRIDWLFNNWKGQIPIEQIFDPYNDTQQWYYIPGFNGYEISNFGNVRSLKNFNRYPFGTLCRYKKDVYELSTNNNERVNITRSELLKLAAQFQNESAYKGYPRATCFIDQGSRNQRKFIDFEKVEKNKKVKKKPVPIRKEGSFFPSFSVKPDKEIKCPIYFENE